MKKLFIIILIFTLLLILVSCDKSNQFIGKYQQSGDTSYVEIQKTTKTTFNVFIHDTPDVENITYENVDNPPLIYVVATGLYLRSSNQIEVISNSNIDSLILQIENNDLRVINKDTGKSFLLSRVSK